MPTIYREKGYRFFFYSNEGDAEAPERPHVHVEKSDDAGKWWLGPLSRDWHTGFSPSQLKAIERIIHEHEQEFMNAWYEYFN